MKRPAIIAVLVLLAAALSCREPLSFEKFIRGDGPYEFEVKMSDTSAVYDFSFYTCIDKPEGRAQAGCIMLDAIWISPSGAEASESVALPLSEGKNDFFTRQIRVPYREGMAPVEAGDWKLHITPGTVPDGWRGLGLIVEKKRI